MRSLPALVLLPILLLFSLSAGVPSLAQTPSSKPAAQDEPVTTLHTGTKLVVVDVVVTDKDGKAVHGLKVEDFAMVEDGKAQVIKNFDEHTLAASVTIPRPTEPGVFTNMMQSSNGPLNILLLDALDTKLEDQGRSRSQLLAYLQAAKPGSRFALFSLDTHLHLLQGFTDDLQGLQAAVTKWKPQIPMLMPNEMDGTSEMGSTSIMSGTDFASSAASKGRNRMAAMAAKLRPDAALSAIDALSRYLAGLPGRKNLIWFAGSFPPIAIMSDDEVSDPTMAGFRVDQQELHDTIDRLSRSQVAIYPIYAPGLGMASAEPDQSPMMVLATQTGGKAYINGNDLQTEVAKSVEDGSSYYTLAYTPTNPNWNGDQRNMTVKLRKAGLSLSYRRSYYANDPDAPEKTRKKGEMTTEGFSPMHLALLYGTPTPTQVPFMVRVLPLSTADEEKPIAGNVMNPKTKGPYRRFAVDAFVDPRAMLFLPEGNGKWHDTMEFITFVYDADGRMVESAATDGTLNLDVSPDVWASRGGLPVHQQVSVPVKGEYTLRVAVHDKQGDRVGAVEVPVATVKNLPVLQAAK